MKFALLAGPLAAALSYVLLATATELSHAELLCLAVTLWCATWWLTEAAPLAATSLLPAIVFPLTGVLSSEDLSRSYGHSIIFLMMGGFMLSKAMEVTRTHTVIAHRFLQCIGTTSSPKLLLALISCSACLSMWVSNTATTLMLVPILIAIVGKPSSQHAVFFLAVAYAASIGGMATPIGTPPNLIFVGMYEDFTGETISFIAWMSYALPIVLFLLAILWAYLALCAPPIELSGADYELALDRRQKKVLGIFALVAALWMTRPLLSEFIPGTLISDTAIAIFGAVLMLSLSHDGQKLLHWSDARQIDWHILLLFGGGLSLAQAFQTTGLTLSIASALSGLDAAPLPAVVLTICALMTTVTEFTSNIATSSLMLPVLAILAQEIGVPPLLLMFAATLSASCAFMLPIATAPNAIVFSSGVVGIKTMARYGLVLNILCALAIATYATIRFG